MTRRQEHGNSQERGGWNYNKMVGRATMMMAIDPQDLLAQVLRVLHF